MSRLINRAGGHLIVLAAMFGLLAIMPVAAQQPGPAKTAITSAAKAPILVAAGLQPSSGGFYAWVMATQGAYNERLATTIREIRSDPIVATLLLAALSFAYGIVHAAGPGHGKAVISSYVLANEQTVRRGIALSFLASLFQALSAILLFALLVFVFQMPDLLLQILPLLFTAALGQLRLALCFGVEQLHHFAFACKQCRINALTDVRARFGQLFHQAARPCALAGLQRQRVEIHSGLRAMHLHQQMVIPLTAGP